MNTFNDRQDSNNILRKFSTIYEENSSYETNDADTRFFKTIIAKFLVLSLKLLFCFKFYIFDQQSFEINF